MLFYIGLFGTIMAVSRGMVPDPHRVVEPEQLLSAVIEETHYLPAEWRGRLHSAYAHQQFSKLFPLKVVIFLHELGSVLTTPLILWFSMPKCALQIVEFFRDFTVHVDGVGHVCSFAVFDFGRHGDPKVGSEDTRDCTQLMMRRGHSLVHRCKANSTCNPSRASWKKVY